jgi:hypothetical protein
MTWLEQRKRDNAGPLQYVIDDIDQHLKARAAAMTPEEKRKRESDRMEHILKTINDLAVFA